MLADALRHHVWATERLLDSCEQLTDEQLTTPVPAIYGSVLDTFRHLVTTDTWYLFGITGGRAGRGRVEDDGLSLEDLRAILAEDRAGWETLIEAHPDPDADIATASLVGATRHAAAGIRLAQVVHHGSDHRSQVCTALTTLGLEPPDIDTWAYAEQVGRGSVET
jgi:uncharacterized damage-inducible protein DinB